MRGSNVTGRAQTAHPLCAPLREPLDLQRASSPGGPIRHGSAKRCRSTVRGGSCDSCGERRRVRTSVRASSYAPAGTRLVGPTRRAPNPSSRFERGSRGPGSPSRRRDDRRRRRRDRAPRPSKRATFSRTNRTSSWLRSLDAVYAISFPNGLPLEPGKRCEWRLTIDGRTEDDWSLAFNTRPKSPPTTLAASAAEPQQDPRATRSRGSCGSPPSGAS